MRVKDKELQPKKFLHAERTRFYWQTNHPYVSLKEKQLLEIVAGKEGDKILEVGCGEAANIVNLESMGRKYRWYGMDISFDKIKFCVSHKIGDFLCADVINLPFRDNSFDVVFARDLLHHVDKRRENVIKEMIRVCRKKGKVILLEANGRNSIYKVFSMIDPSEAGMQNSTPDSIKILLESYSRWISFKVIMKEPSVIFRLFFHYQYGIARMGFEWFVGWMSRKIEILAVKMFSQISSTEKWGYIVVVAEKK